MGTSFFSPTTSASPSPRPPANAIMTLFELASLFLVAETRDSFLTGPKWVPNRDFDASELEGKVVAINGASAGIGAEILKQVVRGAKKVYIFTRNEPKQEGVIKKVKAELAADGKSAKAQTVLINADNASLASIRKASDELIKQVQANGEAISYLFLNAGMSGFDAQAKSKDGYELGWATNALGSHAFLRHLSPLLISSAEKLGTANSISDKSPRVVYTSSVAHSLVLSEEGVLPARENLTKPTGSAFWLYARSKLANIWDTTVFATELGPRGVLVLSAHPGAVATEIGREAPAFAQWILPKIFNPPWKGAIPPLYAAFKLPSAEAQNAYLVPWGRRGGLTKLARNRAAAQDFFDFADELVAQEKKKAVLN